MRLGADRVAVHVWMGSAPPAGDAVRQGGFDVLVLCAQEYQPDAADFPGVEVVHVPLDDAPIGARDLGRAWAAARKVARARLHGRRVLVTCFLGLNRSGLVTAMALCELGWRTRDAIDAVRNARGPRALHNRHFVQALVDHHAALVVAEP